MVTTVCGRVLRDGSVTLWHSLQELPLTTQELLRSLMACHLETV